MFRFRGFDLFRVSGFGDLGPEAVPFSRRLPALSIYVCPGGVPIAGSFELAKCPKHNKRTKGTTLRE